jgi:hypothetical protein
MKLPRRTFLHLVAGAAALPAASRFAWAQAYPSRPVRWISSARVGVICAISNPCCTASRLEGTKAHEGICHIVSILTPHPLYLLYKCSMASAFVCLRYIISL